MDSFEGGKLREKVPDICMFAKIEDRSLSIADAECKERSHTLC